MSEPLTRTGMLEQVERLRAAFPSPKTSADLARLSEVYFEALQRFSLGAVQYAAKRAIEDGQYFPRVSQLRESAAKWETVNRAHVTARFAVDNPETCPVCGCTPTHYTLPDGRRSQAMERFHDAAAHGVGAGEHDETRTAPMRLLTRGNG